jgi:predicted transcriptional regulator
MKTIRELADELGVSKTAIRNEIAKQGLQSSLRKNGNQFVIDEKCESLIKSAFESRNGKIIAKVVCEDTANQNAQVTDNQNEKVCDYQQKIDVLEADNKRLLEEIELLNGQLEENKESNIQISDILLMQIEVLKNELDVKNEQIREKDKQLSDTLQALNQAQHLQAVAESKVKLLEEKREEEKAVESEQKEKKWYHFFRR